MNLEYYENLPDYIPLSEIELYCLAEIEGATKEKMDEFIEKLSILGNHQWHSYEEPSEKLKQALTSWLEENWQSESERFLEEVMGTAYCFALSRSLFEKALLAYQGHDKEEFRQMLAHSHGQFIDPWWSLGLHRAQ